MASVDLAPNLPVPALPEPRATQQGRRALRWGAVSITLVALASGAYLWTRAPAPPSVSYQTAQLDRGPIVARVTASGTLSALVTVNVGSQISGRVASLHADFGSRVSQGQVIASIDPALFRAAVAQAQANHEVALAARARAQAERVNAERQYARSQALSAQGVLSGADLDASEAALGVARANEVSARAAVGQARAALDQAELNLSYTTIVSPIAGVVLSRNVDVGQTVAATFQAPVLFTIAQDLAHMQVDTSIAEADIGKLQSGMSAHFTVDAYPGRNFTGRIRQVRDNAQTIQNVVTYDAVIDVENNDYLLKPGMTANVTVEYQRRDDALRAPNAALRFRPDLATRNAMEKDGGSPLSVSATIGERVIWLLEGGQARAKLIRAGITDGTWTEVTGGDVQAGESAIIEAAVQRRGS
ncbi:MAG TPA: efflux RND transporter periplasmic adaptor subunit [Polyangiaceae bacterium]|jgi:HlyD family secretion protein|nr:efflux RND transporter periplasmic adaptor subunit [Polyangiaceae bacterium]